MYDGEVGSSEGFGYSGYSGFSLIWSQCSPEAPIFKIQPMNLLCKFLLSKAQPAREYG